jgi:hypothetical protein
LLAPDQLRWLDTQEANPYGGFQDVRLNDDDLAFCDGLVLPGSNVASFFNTTKVVR